MPEQLHGGTFRYASAGIYGFDAEYMRRDDGSTVCSDRSYRWPGVLILFACTFGVIGGVMLQLWPPTKSTLWDIDNLLSYGICVLAVHSLYRGIRLWARTHQLVWYPTGEIELVQSWPKRVRCRVARKRVRVCIQPYRVYAPKMVPWYGMAVVVWIENHPFILSAWSEPERITEFLGNFMSATECRVVSSEHPLSTWVY